MIKKICLMFLFILIAFSSAVSAEKIVLLAVDDFQVWWLEDIQEQIVQKHIDNNIPVTLGVIPSGIEDPWGAGDRLKERIKRWDSSPVVEVAQHGYDHNVNLAGMSYTEQYNRLKKGNDLLKNAGVTPRSFIPPFGSADDNTIRVLKELDFHTYYNIVETDISPTQDLLLLEDELVLCKNGIDGRSCIFKDYNSLLSEIDGKIAKDGVALILYHMQDFDSGSGIDTNKANQIVNYVNNLKQQGYTLMTAEQYYQYQLGNIEVDNDKDRYNNIEDCDDNNALINPGMDDKNCDGIDNNCNNLVDEGYTTTATSCGIGVCTFNGLLQCINGKEIDSCAPGSPGTEVCNNLLDDDCDSLIDGNDADCSILPVCGNGICEQDGGESCQTCPEDCGECSAKELKIFPNGQGSNRGWINIGCNFGNNEWQCVDETTANTRDYLRTSGTAAETFTFSDTGLSDETIINRVNLFYYAMWNIMAQNSCFEAMIRQGWRNYFSGNRMCVTNNWGYVSHAYTTNPATGLPWTTQDINNLEAGMHAINPNGGGRVAQVYAVVEYIG